MNRKEISRFQKELPQKTEVHLKELLIAITLSRSRSVSAKVKKIDLGEIGQVANHLERRALNDGKGLEYGRRIIVTYDGELQIDSTDVIGLDEPPKLDHGVPGAYEGSRQIEHRLGIRVASFLRSQPRDRFPGRQDIYSVGLLHAHGTTDMPQSPPDLADLFIEERHPMSGSMSMIICASQKILVFRGEGTPTWDEGRVRAKIELWTHAVVNRIDYHIQYKTVPEQRLVNRRAQVAFLRDMAKQHDLRIFACKSSENVATIQSPFDPNFLVT